jgi:pilus assembly protein CpaF
MDSRSVHHDNVPPAPSDPVIESLPELAELKHRVHRKLVERLTRERLAEIDSPQARSEIRATIAKLVEEERSQLGSWSKELAIDQVLNEVLGLGPLEPLMEDPTISDILVTTPDRVYIERNGRLLKTPVRFKDNTHLQRIIQKIVARVGRRVDELSPMVDARLPDGSRVNAVIAPIAVDGPLLSIRRFPAPLAAEDLVRSGTLNPEMMELLAAAVRAKRNILITGGTGTGKTTLLNVLSAFIAEDERIVTIEDTAELQLKQDHVARMETRPPNIEGFGAIKQRQLLMNALRMRPDRIVVGEVRGEEALDMLQAMNTGNDGSLATIHANNCRDAVRRLELMVSFANPNIPLAAIRQQISASVHLYVHVARLRDGSRRVTQIAESLEREDGNVVLRDLFLFEKKGGPQRGVVRGTFRATEATPSFLERLREEDDWSGHESEQCPEQTPAVDDGQLPDTEPEEQASR